MAARSDVWKWVAGSLAALMISNLGTALLFASMYAVTDEHIAEVVTSKFTEVSRGHGLYAIEGRSRLDRLESSYSEIMSLLTEIRSDIAVIKSKQSE